MCSNKPNNIIIYYSKTDILEWKEAILLACTMDDMSSYWYRQSQWKQNISMLKLHMVAFNVPMEFNKPYKGLTDRFHSAYCSISAFQWKLVQTY